MRHVMVLAVLVTALAGCGSNQPGSTQPPDPNANQPTGPSEPPKTDPEPANTVPDVPPPPPPT